MEAAFFLTQETRELIANIKKAACEYFGITEDDLLKSRRLSRARYLCFYLIKQAGIRYYEALLIQSFNVSRGQVRYGIDQIETEIVHYRDIQEGVKGINHIISTIKGQS